MKRLAAIAVVGCLSIGLLFFMPADAFAAEPLVPCGQDSPDDCTFTDLVTLGQNLANFAIRIAIPLLAVLFAYGGFLYLTSGAAPAKRQQGNKIMTSGVIGFAIMLCAWLGVSLIATLFLDDKQFNTDPATILTPR